MAPYTEGVPTHWLVAALVDRIEEELGEGWPAPNAQPYVIRREGDLLAGWTTESANVALLPIPMPQ